MSASRLHVGHWVAPLVVVVAVLLLLVAPIGIGSTAFARAVENAFHAPLFALVAVASLFWLRHLNWPASPAREYLFALLLTMALGVAGEVAQSLTTTRHPEWVDVRNDLFGAIAGLGCCAFYDQSLALPAVVRRAVIVVVIAALLMVTAPVAQLSFVYWQRWQQLPALATWDSQAGHQFVSSDSAELAMIAAPVCAGEGVALQVSPLAASRWVGVAIEEPWSDWSRYTQLAIDVVNPNDQPLQVVLRINDQRHNNDYGDRFNRTFAIAPHEHALLQVSLADVQAAPKTRQLDLTKVTRLVLFQDASRGAQTMHVCSVRLVR